MIGRLDVAILIACLGAAGVVAVPRHAKIEQQARLAEVAALASAASMSAELAHSRWLAAARPQTVTGRRGLVAVTHGYPSAASLSLMLAEAETAAFVNDGGTWRHASLPPGSACGVAYQPPAADALPPTIVSYTGDC